MWIEESVRTEIGLDKEIRGDAKKFIEIAE
jgi:hypothetical protein